MKYHLKYFVAFLFAFLLLVSFVKAATLSCAIRFGTCDVGEIAVLKLEKPLNGHVGLPNISSYQYRLCCGGIPGLSTACSGNFGILLKLHDQDNSHVEENYPQSFYPNNVCLSTTNASDTVSIRYTDSACDAGYTAVASLSKSPTNAHLGGPTDYTTKVCAAVTVASSGGGGGGGGGTTTGNNTGVNFSGKAYPLSNVNILKDGQLVITTIAGPDANFSVGVTNLSPGNYTFSVYGEDSAGRKSGLFTFPVFITLGATTNISGIFLSPTIDVDKIEVKQGDNIAIFGQSAPNGDVTVSVHSDPEYFPKTKADKNGVYLLNFDTAALEMGQHLTKSKSALDGAITSFGQTVSFQVGTENILAQGSPKCPMKADLNNDCRVNLVDFSIAAYWYKRTLSAEFKQLESTQLSNDGKVDLTDFSIMAYYWTG